MGQNTVLSLANAAHQALQDKRLAALSAQMWARAARHLLAIQSPPGDILNEFCMPLDHALHHAYENLIFAPPQLPRAAAPHPATSSVALELIAADMLAD